MWEGCDRKHWEKVFSNLCRRKIKSWEEGWANMEIRDIKYYENLRRRKTN